MPNPQSRPYLIQQGFLVRTARGRMATRKAYLHLGLQPRRDSALGIGDSASLFEPGPESDDRFP